MSTTWQNTFTYKVIAHTFTHITDILINTAREVSLNYKQNLHSKLASIS